MPICTTLANAIAGIPTELFLDTLGEKMVLLFGQVLNFANNRLMFANTQWQ